MCQEVMEFSSVQIEDVPLLYDLAMTTLFTQQGLEKMISR
mgnify:CR=1 FL=1